MRVLRILAMLALVTFAGVAHASASIISYSFEVTVTSGGGPFAGQTYTGTFLADTNTGIVTDFDSDLLGGSFTAANLGPVATFDGSFNVTKLSFVSSVIASDLLSHSFGFTAGFTPGQVVGLGLDPNNYWAFLDEFTFVQGGGTPIFTTGAVVAPEPVTLALLGTGLVGLVARRRGIPRRS